ncbi:MAG: APC family permease [Steroidobacteraceae bacterium]|jgi:amino acid transporter
MPAALNRSLKFWDLIVYGLAYIAPITPLSTLGFVWESSKGLIALAYVLGGVCMYFTAKSYAIMTETVPSAGSVYGFARHCLGAYPGFLAGWLILLDYLLIPAFVYVLIAVALGTLLPGVDRSIWIVIMVAATLTINWFGVTVTTRANFIAVIIQSLVMFAFLGLALVALSHGMGTGHLSLAPFWNTHSFDGAALLTATSICIMSFLGFDAISTLSEEVEGNDRRVVGRAIIGVLIISALFFVLVTWVLGNLLPGIIIKDPAAATYELAGWAVGPWAAITIAWAYVLVVGLSNALPMQVGVARVLYAMGRDRQLPHALARIHPRYHTPYVSMIVTAIISLSVALAMRNQLDNLATIVNFGALSGFLLLQMSVINHFGMRLRSHAWFAHWLAPLLGIAVVLAVFSGMSALAMKVGLAWLGVGMIYGLILRVRHRDELAL